MDNLKTRVVRSQKANPNIDKQRLQAAIRKESLRQINQQISDIGYEKWVYVGT